MPSTSGFPPTLFVSLDPTTLSDRQKKSIPPRNICSEMCDQVSMAWEVSGIYNFSSLSPLKDSENYSFYINKKWKYLSNNSIIIYFSKH